MWQSFLCKSVMKKSCNEKEQIASDKSRLLCRKEV